MYMYIYLYEHTLLTYTCSYLYTSTVDTCHNIGRCVHIHVASIVQHVHVYGPYICTCCSYIHVQCTSSLDPSQTHSNTPDPPAPCLCVCLRLTLACLCPPVCLCPCVCVSWVSLSQLPTAVLIQSPVSLCGPQP